MTGVQVFRNLVSPENHADIQRFVNDHRRHLPRDQDEMFQRQCANDVPFFTSIHHQLTEFASGVYGKPLKPSYSFLSMYENGGVCPLHFDRRQCLFTVDYLIQQESAEPWPIRISKPMTDVEQEVCQSIQFPLSEEKQQEVISSYEWETVELHPNDAVCYSGTHSWHYRPTPSQGTVDLVFFHFVEENYVGSLQ